MTDRYVNPAVSSSGAGTSWSTAYKTLAEAASAAAAGETIYFANGTADVFTATLSVTFATGVRVISTSDTTNEPPTTYATGATISTTGSYNLTINGAGSFYGLTFSLGDGSDANILAIANLTEDHQEFFDCSFSFGSSGTTNYIRLGTTSAASTNYLVAVNCSFSWGHTLQGFAANCNAELIDCDMSAGGTHPATLFVVTANNANLKLTGCDLSDIDTVFEAAPANAMTGELWACKLKASATIFAPTTAGTGDAFVYDCNSGDTHISFAHHTYAGSTTISTSVYASDNIADSNLSWVVAGSANATKGIPYRSPWIPVYHTGTSAITPYLECLRVAGTPANGVSYLESEAWIELEAKVTSGSTKADYYTNRAGPLDTSTDNTDSSKGAGDWVGEDASNNWYGKLQLNASITPAEVGYIRVRVGLAGQYTLYVDPQVRGLS